MITDKNYENPGFGENDLQLLIIKGAYENIYIHSQLRNRTIGILLVKLQNRWLHPRKKTSKLLSQTK